MWQGFRPWVQKPKLTKNALLAKMAKNAILSKNTDFPKKHVFFENFSKNLKKFIYFSFFVVIRTRIWTFLKPSKRVSKTPKMAKMTIFDNFGHFFNIFTLNTFFRKKVAIFEKIVVFANWFEKSKWAKNDHFWPQKTCQKTCFFTFFQNRSPTNASKTNFFSKISFFKKFQKMMSFFVVFESQNEFLMGAFFQKKSPKNTNFRVFSTFFGVFSKKWPKTAKNVWKMAFFDIFHVPKTRVFLIIFKINFMFIFVQKTVDIWHMGQNPKYPKNVFFRQNDRKKPDFGHFSSA